MSDTNDDGEYAEYDDAPATARSLASQLTLLGVQPGDTLIVHASLSSLGWVVGGEQAVVTALHAAVGPEGTIGMPVQSWQSCDPALLGQTEPRWWPLVRE